MGNRPLWYVKFEQPAEATSSSSGASPQRLACLCAIAEDVHQVYVPPLGGAIVLLLSATGDGLIDGGGDREHVSEAGHGYRA